MSLNHLTGSIFSKTDCIQSLKIETQQINVIINYYGFEYYVFNLFSKY